MLIASHLAGLCQIRRAAGLRRVPPLPRRLAGIASWRGAFGTRHLRAVEPVTSGACGEGPSVADGGDLRGQHRASSLLLRRAPGIREAPQAAPQSRPARTAGPGHHPRSAVAITPARGVARVRCHEWRRCPVLAAARPIDAHGATRITQPKGTSSCSPRSFSSTARSPSRRAGTRVIDPLVSAGHPVIAAANPLRGSPPTPPPSATWSARSTGRSCSSGTPTAAP